MFHRGSFRNLKRRSLSVDDVPQITKGCERLDDPIGLSDSICTLRSKIFQYRQKKNLTKEQEEVLRELEGSLKRLLSLQQQSKSFKM